MSMRVRRKTVSLLISFICHVLPPLSACQFQAVVLPLLVKSRCNADTKFKKEGKFLVADDGISAIRFYSPYRASRYIWPNGVERMQKRMQSKYLKDKSITMFDGPVIDIGANIGEFSMVAAEMAPFVFSFEPDPLASMCLQENVKKYQNVSVTKQALGEHPGSQTFYLSSRLADSSLIKPTQTYRKIEVNVTTLDDFVKGHAIRRISLIKLEAEGAEPEILRGGLEALRITEAITVDISPEREGRSTLREVRELLEESRFQIVSVTEEALYAERKNCDS